MKARHCAGPKIVGSGLFTRGGREGVALRRIGVLVVVEGDLAGELEEVADESTEPQMRRRTVGTLKAVRQNAELLAY